VLLQVDLSKWESALGPGQVGAGPSLHATPSAPLPCHRPGPGGESIIAAGFPYTPHEWSSASATGLACVDDGCGASMAQCHEAHQPATNLTGLARGSVNIKFCLLLLFIIIIIIYLSIKRFSVIITGAS